MIKTKYVFDSKEVRRCIHHAVCATGWTRWSNPKYNNNTTDVFNDPALSLIKDYTGVYLVSAGWPRDRIKNKRVYAAYAKGENNNLKEYISAARNKDKIISEDMSHLCGSRIDCLGIIFLSIGDNGHVLEEILAEMFDEFIVEITPRTEEKIAVINRKPTRGIQNKLAALEMNSDNESLRIKTPRRIMLTEEKIK